ncbi:hypothetical protein CIRG_05155 [Coccidioides immitis RMSCC 2394]|uniref:PX domain-containing protein n=1 Tax=Coccidioides immitis RMSCC 2394 TaxID=404692 RepID=A0A0J6YEK5_COCIT|nr:hypothetical protein CIRG_05155 [Coccidioides immitis RMSCC 2394]
MSRLYLHRQRLQHPRERIWIGALQLIQRLLRIFLTRPALPSSIRRAEQLILDQDRPGSNLSNYPGRNPAENSPLQMHQTKQAETMLALRNAAAASSASQPVPPPARRPPPAPINIDQAARVRPNIEVETGRDRDSNSEYEDADILPEDEIPTFERGRRKTREDDDRHSAALMVQEQEARSRSNKKKAKSIDPPATVQQGQTQQGFHGMGLPSSPRAMLFGQPGPASPWRGAISPPEPLSAMMHGNPQLNLPPGLGGGLPHSPRPGDRPPGSPLPQIMFATPAPAPAPHSPLPAPPGPMDSSVAQSRRGSAPESEQKPLKDPALNIPTFNSSVQIDSPTFLPQPRPIYQGLVSEEYPSLLLPPNALPSIKVKVSSSRLHPSRMSYLALKPSGEDPVFMLSVISRATRSKLWRVEKVIIALPQLDQQVRQTAKLPFKLPDRSIFSGHSSAKIDSRRAALNTYFSALLVFLLDEASALVLCQFLTANAIEPRDNETSLVNAANANVRERIVKSH